VIRIHQVWAAAAPADAVTAQAFAWRERFRSWGVDGELLAEHVHPELAPEVTRLAAAPRRLLDGGVVILHYSVWSAAVDAALRARAKRVLWYHNITPGSLLRDFNPEIAALCDQGRSALPRLNGPFDLHVAVSAFNAVELREAGIDDVVVVPLLLDIPDAPTPMRDPDASPRVVTVGRVVPNKRIEDVIKVFALYRRYRAADATLTVVGSDEGFEEYRERLELLARSLIDGAVRFTGRVSSEERDHCYDAASVYLCMSAHEGFCAPLIEALGHGTPVVARNAGAVSETLDGAGIVIDDRDFAVFAEAVHEAASSQDTRAALGLAATRRLESLAPATIEARVQKALAPLLS
jgi:glycosyltransferase involved in cell wall biosynthesis